ncbi:MAG: hypothetical protein Q8R37_03375 [Nanoarchaeota archaeon]|nr:hypothetical protein [Nanoarchaeota archaeon]
MEKKKVIVAIAIALIFALFIGYGIEVFNPTPKYDKFCPQRIYEARDETSCTEAGGVWQEDTSVAAPKPVPAGYCNQPKECYEDFDQAAAKHDKMVFIIAVIFGLAGIVTGIILQKETVGVGLLIGGILTILYGTIRYWQHANSTLKFILLGIVLAVLIWIGYKKLEKK